MADASDPTTGGGEEAFAYLQTIGIPDLVGHLIQLTEVARSGGMMTLADDAGAILDGLLKEVNTTAVEMAGLSEGAIIREMFATHSARRPITGNMETHVISQAGALGSVRVALISELDKIVNERGGYDPFWRAQEYGTGSTEGGYGGGGVPEQEGRPMFGTFEPSGTPPDSAERGLGMGHDLTFEPMGQAPGFGRISVELPGRHFLRHGSEETGAAYVKRMGEIQEKWLLRLRELMAQAKRERRRLFSGTIEA